MPLKFARSLAVLPVVVLGLSAWKPSPKPRARPEVGRIVGSVEVSAALTSRRPRFRVYADAGPGSTPPARPHTDVAGELRNVVVYLDTGVVDQASARMHTMAQADERFDPHVLPVVAGAVVEFPNRDAVYHNVFSLSSPRTFDLGRYPKGSSKSVRFNKPGIVQVFCHIHSDMSAVVVVVPSPFYAGPDSTGRYVIENVPPGEYSVVGWHERTRPAVRRVRVVAGQTTTLDFSLPLSPGPGR